MGIIKSKIPTWPHVCTGLARLQPWYLLTKYQNRWSRAVFAFVNACMSIGIISVAAAWAEQPLIFPTLGPISFLCFYSPSAGASSPRNVISAHGAGVIIGWLTVYAANSVFGVEGMATQIVAVTFSLGLITAVMIIADIPHPPAAATTLLVSLGSISELTECLCLMAAVVTLAAQGFIINRLCGVYYPIWKTAPNQAGNTLVATALSPLHEATHKTTDLFAGIADQIVTRQRIERRWSHRIPVSADSGLQMRVWEPDGTVWSPRAVNISSNGILFENTDDSMPHIDTGTCIEIEIRLHDHCARIEGEVKRHQGDRKYAISFLKSLQSNNATARKALRSIIRDLQS